MHHQIFYDMRLYVRFYPIVPYGPGREIYAFAMPRKIPASFETNWYCAFLFIFAPKVALLRVNLSFLDFQTKSCVRAALIRSIKVMRVGSVVFCGPFIQNILRQKRFKKLAWIWSHHLQLKWKFKLLAGKPCWMASTNVLFSKMPTSINLSRP